MLSLAYDDRYWDDAVRRPTTQLITRQRYWGEPFPIIYDDTGIPMAVPEAELPALAYTRGVLDALGVHFGAAFTEVVLEPELGPVLIECNARLIGAS